MQNEREGQLSEEEVGKRRKKQLKMIRKKYKEKVGGWLID